MRWRSLRRSNGTKGGSRSLLCADRIVRRCPQVFGLEGTVNIVAVAALDQAFFEPVMKGLTEGGLHIRVAGKAKFRLRVASPMCTLSIEKLCSPGGSFSGAPPAHRLKLTKQ